MVVTDYFDSEKLLGLRQFMDEHNKTVFNLQSVREVATVSLTEEQQTDHTLDYISAVNVLDSKMRVIIIEGLTGPTIEAVKSIFPKEGVNTSKKAVFSNRRLLDDKRIYSVFGLSMKFIKLREDLSTILKTFDIYSKASVYPLVYKAMINLGSLLKTTTLREIYEFELLPSPEALQQIERKYSDIIKEVDTTGILKEKTKIGRLSVEELNKETQTVVKEEEKIEIEEIKTVSSRRQKKKGQLDSFNTAFLQAKKRSEGVKIDHVAANIAKVQERSLKNKRNTFYLREEAEEGEVFMYSSQKLNSNMKMIAEMKERLNKQKDAYFAYPGGCLSHSFLTVKEKTDFEKKKESEKVDL